MTLPVETLIGRNDAIRQFDAQSVETLGRLTAGVNEIVDRGATNQDKLDVLDDWESVARMMLDTLQTCRASSERLLEGGSVSEDVRNSSTEYFDEQEVLWREIAKPRFADALTDVIEDTGKLLRTKKECAEKTNVLLAKAEKQNVDLGRLLALLALTGTAGAIQLLVGLTYEKLRAKHLEERYKKEGMTIKDEVVLVKRRKHWVDYAHVLVKIIDLYDNVRSTIFKEALGRQVTILNAASQLTDVLVDYHRDVNMFLDASGSMDKADELRALIDQVEALGRQGPARQAIHRWVERAGEAVEEYREALGEFMEVSGAVRQGVFLRSETKLSSETDEETRRSIERLDRETGQLYHRLMQESDVELRLLRRRLAEMQEAARGEMSPDDIMADGEAARRIMYSDDVDVAELYREWQKREK